ncbi:MAG: class I SAM-dependent methyltransferase [Planctomycetes bacterium]|nr:class I SAM-dependent methyltransferase [Planctomycetota bacterium]
MQAKKKINITSTTIDEIAFQDSSFEAVTAFYVLEHITNPISALRKIFMMLKPEGILVLRIPHTTPIVRFLSVLKVKNNLYDTPYHLYDFSPKIIKQLLEKAGFSLVQVKPGSPTCPDNYLERIISVISGNIAKLFFAISLGKFLLPGTSKTIIAFKQPEGIRGLG